MLLKYLGPVVYSFSKILPISREQIEIKSQIRFSVFHHKNEKLEKARVAVLPTVKLGIHPPDLTSK